VKISLQQKIPNWRVDIKWNYGSFSLVFHFLVAGSMKWGTQIFISYYVKKWLLSTVITDNHFIIIWHILVWLHVDWVISFHITGYCYLLLWYAFFLDTFLPSCSKTAWFASSNTAMSVSSCTVTASPSCVWGCIPCIKFYMFTFIKAGNKLCKNLFLIQNCHLPLILLRYRRCSIMYRNFYFSFKGKHPLFY
jgi:hypothetical protein